MSLYKCPVCGNSLKLSEKTYRCDDNHCYDISKKGYVNLILANQGQHIVELGDKKDMVEARSRFLDAGFYDCLRQAIISIIKNKFQNDKITIADLACGEGYYTSEIKRSTNSEVYGVDISKSAINHACTRRNLAKQDNLNYCIGNLDYLPYLDESFDCLINCFAPINEREFFRVMKKGGIYIRVLPGVNHLLGLKKALYEDVRLNEPKEEHIDGLRKIGEISVDSLINLSNGQIRDLFVMTPYYYKTSKEAIDRLYSLEKLETEISFSIRIYEK